MGVDRALGNDRKTTSGFGDSLTNIPHAPRIRSTNTIKILMIPRDTGHNMETDLSGNVLGKNMQHLNLAMPTATTAGEKREYMVGSVSLLGS